MKSLLAGEGTLLGAVDPIFLLGALPWLVARVMDSFVGWCREGMTIFWGY